MVLNIFPRRERAVVELAPEPERTLPEPSPESLDEAPRKTTRRGTRGGRGRRKPGADGVAEIAQESSTDVPEAEAPGEAPAPAPRRRGSRAAAVAASVATDEPPAGEPAAEPQAEAPKAPAKRQPKAQAQPAAAGTPDLSALVRAVEAQGKQIEHLVRSQEDFIRRAGTGGGGVAAAPPARVGVFVDAANVELAVDRLRQRIDWKKVLNHLTENRTLVRAIAYSPVHDDPGVSLETQRFAEPFLGKGYKVVTKPLKRFADGTIKANVDIEMALDIVEMLDRLDVVCLVSGDGDFQRLVEVVQGKGVRCEVVAVGNSAAGALRNAADHFIDLAAIVGKLKA